MSVGQLPEQKPFTAEQVQQAYEALEANPYAGRNTVMSLLDTRNNTAVRKLVKKLKAHMGIDPTSKRNKANAEPDPYVAPIGTAEPESERLKVDMQAEGIVVEGVLPRNRYSYAETIPHLLDAAEVDTELWEVYRQVVNRWGTAENPSWQCKAWLRPVEADLYHELINGALATLQGASKVMQPLQHATASSGPPSARRALEISIMDPHLGGIFYPPASEHAWDLDQCARLWHYGIDTVLERAAVYGPFERILFVLGNDFMHADNVFHTTTAGTGQPEMAALHHVAVYGEQLLIETIEQLAAVTDVDVLFIPGNHARWTEFMLARVIKSRFHNNPNVMIDAEPTPYKAWHYGCNLVAFEHGHSAKTATLAALMAAQWAQPWAATEGGYREWHLGDQHRKGNGNALTYEEQGVSVQGLPGLTPANEWHKIKAFNHQKRVAATGFVWDYHHAKYAEIPVCLDGKTGEPFAAAP